MITDNLPTALRRLLSLRRRARVRFMLSKVATKPDMKVVDIGCGIDGRSFDDHVPSDWKITGVDIIPPESVRHEHPNFTYVERDAQDLSVFQSNQFDLAVSIGMLEHIIDDPSFGRIVSEIRRVARQHVVVVPFRYAWVEPHFGFPFFPVFPYPVKLALVKALNLGNDRRVVVRDPEYIRRTTRWRSNAEYRTAFPDSGIHLLPTLEMIAIVRRCEL